MNAIGAGDLVKRRDSEIEMMVVSADEECSEGAISPAFFCVWEHNHFLHEELIGIDELVLVRRERRRVPRGGILNFPCSDVGPANSAIP